MLYKLPDITVNICMQFIKFGAGSEESQEKLKSGGNIFLTLLSKEAL